MSDLVTKQILPSLLPPYPALLGDVTGDYDDNEIWTLGKGTIDVNKIVTEAKLPSLLPPLPILAGDVTGTLSDNKVMSLNGGMIPLNHILTIGGEQQMINKIINHGAQSATTSKELARFDCYENLIVSNCLKTSWGARTKRLLLKNMAMSGMVLIIDIAA